MKSFEVAELGSPEAIQAQPPFHPASVNKVNKDITCAPCLVWGAGDILTYFGHVTKISKDMTCTGAARWKRK